MKRVFLLLALAISFMACEGPVGPMGPSGMDGMNGRDGMDGKDGKDGIGTNWLTKTFTIQPHEWELVGTPGELNSFFLVDRKLPELTKDIFKERAVIAYIKTDDGYKNGMPYVLHKGGTGDNGKEFIWTQTYDFDYSEGWVGFYLTYSDFNTQLKPEDPTTFYIVLMW
ncbi:hypothetical protein D0T87_06830 [Bacteroides sp. 51]|nr:hypothetical protein [Bacteroides sp. 51]